MAIPLRVLIVEDSEDDAALLARELRRGGYDLTYERVDTAVSMVTALENKTWDIIFSDHSMPRFSGTEALAILREKGFDLPFIFVSGTIGEDNAVAAMKVGAHDYIMKNNMTRLFPAVERELREAKNRYARRLAEEQLKVSFREKEILLQEVHHRVKNNLQVVSSILNLQSQSVRDKQAIQLFKDCQARIKSIALVHEKLHQAKELVRIDFGDYTHTLATNLCRLYKSTPTAVSLVMDIHEVFLDIDMAVPCGMLISELVSNSLKYAFPENRKGKICIRLSQDPEHNYVLTIGDDGVGFPKDLDFRQTETLGLQLVVTLTDQLDGTIQLSRDPGTTFTIRFPEQTERRRMKKAQPA